MAKKAKNECYTSNNKRITLSFIAKHISNHFKKK